MSRVPTAKAFRRLLRESNVDANAVAAWEAAYKARTYNIKANTTAATRANIIEKEAKTFDALTELLSDAGDAAERLVSASYGRGHAHGGETFEGPAHCP